MRALFGLSLSFLSTLPALAADHRVEVYNYRFVPEVVEIAAGDTVTWVVRQGTHNVVAENGSFRSGAPSSRLEFSQRFDVPGTEVRYKSDAGSGMLGAVVVKSTGSAEIGAAMQGLWWTEGAFGQGLMLEFVPSANGLFAAWYTYAPDGSPDWAAGGAYLSANNTEVTIPLTAFDQGELGRVANPPSRGWGQITLKFSDCNNGSLNWTRTQPPASGTLAIKRFHPLAKCF